MKKKYSIALGLCIGVLSIVCDQYIMAIIETSGTELSEKEKKEYEELSKKNAEAKQIFNDLQVFAVLSHDMTKFFPEKKEIRGVNIPVREIMQSVVGVMYNVSELGLGILQLIEEQVEPLNKAVECLKYTDEELKSAQAGKYVDKTIEKCLLVGCGNKKACVASSIKKISLAIRTIFDPAVVKYNPETGTSQRGLLMNIDMVIDQLVKILLQTKIVRDSLDKVKSGGATTADDFVKNIDRLRRVVLATGQVFSGILEALIIASGQLAPESISPAEREKYKEVFAEANTEKIKIDESALDDLLLEFKK